MTRPLVARDVFRYLDPDDPCRAGGADYFPRRPNPFAGCVRELSCLDGVAQVMTLFAIKPQPSIEHVQPRTHPIASLGRPDDVRIAFEGDPPDSHERIADDFALEPTLPFVRNVSEHVAAASWIGGNGASVGRRGQHVDR